MAVAITPDGKHAYVTNEGAIPGTVSVIDTGTNTVVATVAVGNSPRGVAIGPAPSVTFAAFKAALAIEFGTAPNTDAFEIFSEFTLGQKSNGIYPPMEPVTLSVGTFTRTIPAGSFKGTGFGPFYFIGPVNGVNLEALIVPTGAKRFSFAAAAQKASLTRTANPVPVTLTIGDDSGTTMVNAVIFGP
jgi:YVTN family beta-propeller protein